MGIKKTPLGSGTWKAEKIEKTSDIGVVIGWIIGIIVGIGILGAIFGG